MPLINKDKFEDAAMLTEKFLMKETVKHIVLRFLSDSIIWANSLKPENWNLNLDKNGQFIRFNVGQEYCIEIDKDGIQVLCLKEILKKSILNHKIEVQFKGYLGRKKVLSSDINIVPNCLAKVPDSVACYIKYDNISDNLPLLKSANKAFIEYAILRTRQLPGMKSAHSSGYLDYLQQIGFLEDETSIDESQEEINIAEELSINDAEQLNEGMKKTIVVNTYERNPKAREKCIKYWGVNCAVCEFNFEKIFGKYGKGFIHVHHLVPVSTIGKEYKIDPIQDLRPVCPNCHSMLHRNNPPLTIEELKNIIQNK